MSRFRVPADSTGNVLTGIGHSGELRNKTLERGIWFAITHHPHIQADIHNFRHRPAHGVMDPWWFVAKGSATQPSQKQCVRARAASVDDDSPESGFIGKRDDLRQAGLVTGRRQRR